MEYETESRILLGKILCAGTKISKVYQKKAIIYGNTIELYEYVNTKVTFVGTCETRTRRFNAVKTDTSINRARKTLFRLVEANHKKHGYVKSIFVTLTFAENVTDLKIANAYYKLFVKRLNYMLGTKLRYVCVPEWQKRGAVHFHVVFFNLPFVHYHVLEQVWGYGSTNVQAVKHVRSIASYIAKYLTKSLKDPRLYGQKSFMTSRGLYKPEEIYGGYLCDEAVARAIITHKKEKSFEDVKLSIIKTKPCNSLSLSALFPVLLKKVTSTI